MRSLKKLHVVTGRFLAQSALVLLLAADHGAVIRIAQPKHGGLNEQVLKLITRDGSFVELDRALDAVLRRLQPRIQDE